MFSFTPVEGGGNKLRRIRFFVPAMTLEERQEVRREALKRAMAIVQQYQDENWRRLRVNDICSDIKRRLNEEAGRWAAGLENERNSA